MSSILSSLPSRTILHFTCELWAQDQHNILHVKVHYIDDDWKLCHVPLAVYSILPASDSAVIQWLLKDLLSQLGFTAANIGTISFNSARETLAVYANNQLRTRKEMDEPRKQNCGTEIIETFLQPSVNSSMETQSDWVALPEVKQLPCIAHQLQIVLRTALEDSEQEKALQDLWSVVRFFRNSPAHAERLASLTKQQLVDRDASSRDSNHVALDWITRVHPHVDSVLSEAQLTTDSDVLNVKLRDKAYYSDLLAILEAFREASSTLQADDVTSSLVLPTLVGLSNFLIERRAGSRSNEHIQRLLDELHAGLKNRFRETAAERNWTMATLLDPRFRLESDFLQQEISLHLALRCRSQMPRWRWGRFFRNAEKLRAAHPDLLPLPSSFLAESTLRKAVDNPAPTPSINSSGPYGASNPETPNPSGSLIESFIRKCRQQPEESKSPAEIRMYLTSATEYDPQLTPLQFWSNLAPGFPNLSRLARRYLSVPVAAGSNLEKLLDTAETLDRLLKGGTVTNQIEDILLLREVMDL